VTALQSSETWPAVPVAVNPDGAERVVLSVLVIIVKELIVREPLKFVFDLLVFIVLETLIVQSAYVPSLRELKVMVLFPEIAMVVLEEHEPP
jgi:NADH:ubiquinone oxidoreductase subunit H